MVDAPQILGGLNVVILYVSCIGRKAFSFAVETISVSDKWYQSMCLMHTLLIVFWRAVKLAFSAIAHETRV